MKIKQISATDLFGTFDHVIPLNLSEHVTIIIGPNGYGKTTILKMLYGLFSGRFSIFFKIPFSEFALELDNGGYIRIEKKFPRKPKKDPIPFDLNIILSEDGTSNKKFNLASLSPSRSRDLYYFARNFFDDEVIERNLLNQMRHGYDYPDIDTLFPIIEKYWDVMGGDLVDTKRVPTEIMRMGLPEIAPMLVEIRKFTKDLNVHLIQAQRLTSRPKIKSEKKVDEDLPAVKIYSDELAKLIGDKLAQSTERAQKLDSTFPHRVISQKPPIDSKEAYAKLRDELQKLREKRIHLKETGILVELGGELEIPEFIQDEDRLNFLNGVLTEYVRDTQEKLVIFDELSDKIEILKRIINERFVPHKRLEINKDKGFIFITSTDSELAPSDLSSGEQHELVLLYELLFKVPAGSLVLIDEPELSLHIAWQQKFLGDLLAITDIAKLDVLIATHAPDIIHHHWDLTVDLGELKSA